MTCATYVCDVTGKGLTIEFCEKCPKFDDCNGELDEFTLRKLVKENYGKLA